MKPKVKIGIVGAGFVGQLAHLMNYVEIPDCAVVALAELRPELRKKVAQRYNIPRTYSTHLELLQDPEVEAVVVITRRPTLGPVAYDCLKAKKHVLTEKPMASTAEQAERLVATAKENGVQYVIGYERIHDEGVQKAKAIMDELLKTKELGEITFARAHCFMGESYCNIDGHIMTDEKIPLDKTPEWPIAPDWISAESKNDYAAFVNVYCHNINLLRYLIGQTPKVDYAGIFRNDGQIAVLNFGAFGAVLEAGRGNARQWDEVTEIYFTNGRLRVETPPHFLRNVPARVELYREKGEKEVLIPQASWTWSFRRQAEDFVRTVRENGSSAASGAVGLEDIRLIEEIWKNGKKDKTV